jgi:hypothetical protein
MRRAGCEDRLGAPAAAMAPKARTGAQARAFRGCTIGTGQNCVNAVQHGAAPLNGGCKPMKLQDCRA